MKSGFFSKLSKYKSITDKGLAPWVNWESENCSFGVCFRSYGFYPKFLPLFINSDHAVHWESKIWNNEKKNYPYITWNYRKFKKLNIECYYVTHPWVHYKKNYNKNSLKKGTVVFFPHRNYSTKPVFKNIEHYFQLLKNLPKRYKPITIMLSHFEISDGYQHKLKKYGFNIVTAGNTNSIKFVKNFYDIISKFEYATSPMSPTSVSSAFFYSVNFGLSFFFLGKNDWKVFSNEGFLKKGKVSSKDYGDSIDIKFLKKINKTFYFSKNNELTADKQKMVVKYMGLDSDMTRYKFSYILWKSFLLNVLNLNIFKLYYKHLGLLFKK